MIIDYYRYNKLHRYLIVTCIKIKSSTTNFIVRINTIGHRFTVI